MTNDQIADVLDRAADALMFYGRTAGAMQRDDGRMCVQGAIIHAQGKLPKEARLHDFDDPCLVAYETWLTRQGCPLVDFEKQLLVTAIFNELKEGKRIAAFIFNDVVAGIGPEGDGLVIDTLRRAAKDLRA